jgi:hypothetical protein
MTTLEAILNNPQGVTFSVLFIALLGYVMKTNDAREQRYQNTIDKLTEALNTFDDLRDKIESLIKGE